jgi:hypothetical protein
MSKQAEQTVKDKQGALVEAIGAGVAELIEPGRQELLKEVLGVRLTVSAILARLETLENALNSGAAPKRAVRTGAGAKKATGKAGGAKKTPGGDPSKVSNALLYFRYATGNNLSGVRDTYCTPEGLAAAENDPTVSKQSLAKDEISYYSAVGAYLWKNELTEDQKDEIRTQFTAWKEQNARDDADPQLEEDVAE